MSKGTFVIAVIIAVITNLSLSAPSKADYITTVTALNTSGMNAIDFESTFFGTSGSISNVEVLFSSGIATTTQVISSGTGVEVDFAVPLPDLTGVVVFNFETTSGPITLNTAVWTFNSGAPIPVLPDAVVVASQPSAVPEPASLTLLSLGAVGLFGYGWRRQKRAVKL